VLSENIANALDFYGDLETSETEVFVRKMDKFFDCLNGRNKTEHVQRNKPNLAPYTNTSDIRFKVSQLCDASKV